MAPGKFEFCVDPDLAEALYSDEPNISDGDTTEYGIWFAMYTDATPGVHAILREDALGFVYMDLFTSVEETRQAYNDLMADYTDWAIQEDEEE